MSENKSTESETPAAVSGVAPCSAFPSASEFRTAAKVIRYICDKSDEMQQKLPLLEKLWWKLTRENNDELRRKSAVIESIADRLDTPNAEVSDHRRQKP